MSDGRPSAALAPTGPTQPARQRADGRLLLEMARLAGRTRVMRLSEAGSARLRLPNVAAEAVPEAVIINTAGGIAGGDRFATAIDLGPGAALVATTAAAERVYRSHGPESVVVNRVTLASGAHLDWIPQETLLFDGGRLARSLEAELAPDASGLFFEAVVFGRVARGERVETGSFVDRWRIRRGGRLVFADATRLDGGIAALLDRASVAGGGRAWATALYCAPDAADRLEDARALLDGAACECGASAWNGMLLLRWLSPDPAALRRDAARFMLGFRGRPLPRVWTL